MLEHINDAVPFWKHHAIRKPAELGPNFVLLAALSSPWWAAPRRIGIELHQMQRGWFVFRRRRVWISSAERPEKCEVYLSVPRTAQASHFSQNPTTIPTVQQNSLDSWPRDYFKWWVSFTLWPFFPPPPPVNKLPILCGKWARKQWRGKIQNPNFGTG
jgi:hypothetical protein